MSKKMGISFVVGFICLSFIILYVGNHVKPTIVETEPIKESKPVSKEDEKVVKEATKAMESQMLYNKVEPVIQAINKNWDIIIQSTNDCNNKTINFSDHMKNTALLYIDIQKKWNEINKQMNNYKTIKDDYINTSNIQLKTVTSFEDWEETIIKDRHESIVKQKYDEALKNYNESKKAMDDIVNFKNESKEKYPITE